MTDMKQKVFAFLVFILSINSANAQKAGFELAIPAIDIVIESLNGDISNSFIGFNAGMTFDFPISENISISPDILFYQKRGIYSKHYFNDFYSISYLDMPIHITGKKYYNDMVVYFKAGPYIGYGLGANEYTDDYRYHIKLRDKESVLARTDVGVSFALNFGTEEVYIGISFEQGLKNISNISSRTTKTRACSLSLGCMF